MASFETTPSTDKVIDDISHERGVQFHSSSHMGPDSSKEGAVPLTAAAVTYIHTKDTFVRKYDVTSFKSEVILIS